MKFKLRKDQKLAQSILGDFRREKVELYHHANEFQSDSMEQMKEEIEEQISRGWSVKTMASPLEGTLMVVYEREQQDGRAESRIY